MAGANSKTRFRTGAEMITEQSDPEALALLASPAEDYMSPAQLNFFRRRLLELQAELLQAEADTEASLKAIQNAADPLDRAAQEEALTLELHLRRRERRLLVKIEAALLRVERGTYGWCQDTGEPIGLARLLARPTTTLCLDAQRQRERRQAIHGQ